MKIYNQICKCGCPLTAIVELDKDALGGYSVQFSDNPGARTALSVLGPGSSKLCPVCRRVVSTDFSDKVCWELLALKEQPDAPYGSFVIRDCTWKGRHLVVDVHEEGQGMLLLRPKGYGDKCSANGCGDPVGLAFSDGELKVYLWEDINVERPRVISLEGAREDARKEG